MSTTKKIIIILVVLILLLIIIIFLNNFIKTKKTQILINQEEKINQELLITQGVIYEIDSDSITIMTEKYEIIPNPNQEKEYENIKFILTKETDYFKNTNNIKNNEDFLKEQEEYNIKVYEFENLGKNTSLIEPPSWYITEEITRTDLIKGLLVKIISQRYENKNIAIKVFINREQATDDSLRLVDKEKEVTLYGFIKYIDENILVINEFNQDTAINNTFLGEREIVIDENVEIYTKVKITKEEFLKLQEKYNNTVRQLREQGKDYHNMTPPSWFYKEEQKLNTLKPNQNIKIIALLDTNNTILAKSIELVLE